jgi:hypothetical protein
MIEIMDQGVEHEYSWLYDTGLGFADDEKALIYVFNIRSFFTLKNKEMSNIYAWDGKKIIKIVLFPAAYIKLKNLIKETGWYAIKMVAIQDRDESAQFDSYKIENDRAAIKIEEYIERKGLKDAVNA